MMNTPPSISVVMPVYNGSKYLREAIDSVLIQDFSDFEFIIVNDGSTDESESIIFSYVDKRIKYIKQDNAGVGGALKTGCNVASGKYIARMDSDDICMPNRFYEQKFFLDKNPLFVLVGSAVININESGDYLSRSFPYTSNYILQKLVKNYSPICHPSVMMHRSAYNKSGGYEEFEPLEDIFMWVKLSNIGKLENLSIPLLKYRIVESSVSRSITYQQSNFLREYLFKIKNDQTFMEEKIITFKKMYQQIRNDAEMINKEEITSTETEELLLSYENKTYKYLKQIRLPESIIENVICNIKKLYAILKYN